MYTVYVLQDSLGKLYKGVTNNLKRRLAEHKSGHTLSTKKLKKPEVVYTEEYDSFKKARKREIYFKNAAGRRFLKKHIAPIAQLVEQVPFKDKVAGPIPAGRTTLI